MQTKDLATLLAVAPAGTLNLAASDGPGPKPTSLLRDLARGTPVAFRNATSVPATSARPTG